MDKSQRSHNSWSAKQFKRSFEKGTINFDHPIQRREEQWDHERMSLLIHSMAECYPVPQVYAVKKDGVYSVLDGKQRLTTAFKFLDNGFALHEATPDVNGVEVAGLTFDELPEEIQDDVKDYHFSIISFENITFEEIEEIFFRVNSGVPLSNIQKAKAKLGIELSEKMGTLVSHALFQDKIKFSNNQVKKEEDLKVISEFIMLYDDEYEMTNAGFTPTEVTKYVGGLRARPEQTEEFINVCQKVFDALDKIIDEPNKQFLKPTNLPMLFNVTRYALENKVSPVTFKNWYDEFTEELKVKNEDEQTKWVKQYKSFGGNGSKKPEKIKGRVTTLVDSLKDFVKTNGQQISIEDEESIEGGETEELVVS
ncbi:hypothetical protein COL77_16400 [Bacillus wiedmannii]|uniref:GmrSD restriction endonuclease domain-containing protein n=1 Tax=Bacillus wiedmannii TaxID=1890302 RepID=UPI000BF55C5D|nr:DUF262 domain-containing protein [Bacillus wiedmannii]PFZ41976.1 hypothetical protein COL77_16400 [Bacillus wiedmannii]